MNDIKFKVRLADRFLRKIQKSDSTDCWLWTAKTDRFGYGKFAIKRKEVCAHRFSYEHFIGEIPDGLVIDHLCKNRGCVNPSHLEPVTQRENLMRSDTIQARNAAKTHCVRGHEFSGSNLYVYKDGSRRCMTCSRMQKENARRSAGVPSKCRYTTKRTKGGTWAVQEVLP